MKDEMLLSLSLTSIIVILIISAIFITVFIVIEINRYKMVKISNGASDYINKDTIKQRKTKDTLVNTTVHKREKMKSESNKK